VRNAVRLVLLCLLLFATASELCASIPKTRVGEIFSLAADPRPEIALQVPELRLENWCLYDESASGRLFWTKFDPEGLEAAGIPKMYWTGPELLQAGKGLFVNGPVNLVKGAVQASPLMAAKQAFQDTAAAAAHPDGFIAGMNQQSAQKRAAFVAEMKRLVTTPDGMGELAFDLITLRSGGGASAEAKVAETSAKVAKETSEAMVVLEHGTTLQRAKQIAKTGPDAAFVEPGGILDSSQGFSTSKPGVSLEKPIDYALGKAEAFPGEGGPAILRMEMPESVANFGADLAGNEVRFNKAGTDALRWNWDKVKTTVTPVEKVKDAAR